MGAPITLTRTPVCAGSPEEDLPPFRKENFSGFSPEPFPGATTAATIIITTATPIIIIIIIATTTTSGTPIRVKAFFSGETF